MPVPQRTLRDIRTMAARVDRIANPYMAYMQITCLEMEKARKGRERASALHRVETLNARLREIDAQTTALLHALAQRGAAPALMPPSPGSRPAPHARSGLKLRY